MTWRWGNVYHWPIISLSSTNVLQASMNIVDKSREYRALNPVQWISQRTIFLFTFWQICPGNCSIIMHTTYICHKTKFVWHFRCIRSLLSIKLALLKHSVSSPDCLHFPADDTMIGWVSFARVGVKRSTRLFQLLQYDFIRTY